MRVCVLLLVLIIYTALEAVQAAILPTNDTVQPWPEVPLTTPTSIPSIENATPAASASTTRPSGTTVVPPIMASYIVKVPPTASTQAPADPNTGTNALKSSNSTNSTSGQILDDTHQLQPGDRISFQIVEDHKDPVSLTVTDSRELDIPYIGRVSVDGKTCKQLAAELKPMLEKDYYYHATVIVGLDWVNKLRGQAYICGLVHNQGSVNLLFDQNLTAGEAILAMGGLSDFADKKNVKIIRNHTPGSTSTNEVVLMVNMEDILEKGEVDKDIILQPGDFVIVPARMLNF